MAKDFKLQDNSGDKQYFTIIPNYILNHSSQCDRDVYIQMKRIAGEKGTCWMSQQTLSKQCGISVNTLKKSLKYLLEHSWLELVGQKQIKTHNRGIQQVNEYSITDLWNMNQEYYQNKKQPVSRVDTRQGQPVSRVDSRPVSNFDSKEYLYNKEYPYIAETSSATYNPLGAEIIKEFESINPACKRMYNNKTQREACDDLIAAYTLERVIDIVEKTLPKTNTLQFFPTITTPVQLRDKFATLEAAIEKYRSEKLSKNKTFII